MEAAPMAETHVWRSQILNDYSNTFKTTASWDQEKAFAEDTAAAVWPPRSYSCNFCMRQFRSAQALGGHMNVHRRDRARLQNHHPNRPFFIKPNPTLHLIQTHHSSSLISPKNNNNNHKSDSTLSLKRPKISVSSHDHLDLELKL